MAGWRILIFLAFFATFSSLIFVIRPLLGDISKKAFVEDYSLIIIAISAFSATVATFLSRKYIDKKTFVSLGLVWGRPARRDLWVGFLLSFAMAASFFLISLALGLIEFNGFNFEGFAPAEWSNFAEFMSVLTIGSLFLLFLETVLVGYWEELVFRGYFFQNMVDGMGLIVSVIISCLLYGLIHSSNPNATLLSSIIIVGFGFLRLYGYLGTKMLWLSMGMHIGWNFFQGPIFGYAASGHQSATLLSHSFISNQTYLTGGEFGPEGSVLIIPILSVTLWFMHVYSMRYYESKA